MADCVATFADSVVAQAMTSRCASGVGMTGGMMVGEEEELHRLRGMCAECPENFLGAYVGMREAALAWGRVCRTAAWNAYTLR